MTPGDVLDIPSSDPWVKIVEMLQHNWAFVQDRPEACTVYFVHDGSGLFDELTFTDTVAAAEALHRNGFERLAVMPPAWRDRLRPPTPPFRRVRHPNGPIYSSGRFWR